MAKICEGAAIHLGIGALEKRLEELGGVTVGEHRLGNARVTLDYPDFAMVVRGEGEGDGFEAPKIPTLALSLQAVLLFLQRSTLKGGAKARKLWADCIRDSLKGVTATPPLEAQMALTEVMSEQPPEPVRRKCAAKRTGTEQVQITIKGA